VLTTVLLLIIGICGYFLGGFNGAIIASKYIFKKDIRKYGSGNAGLTNFYRTFGPVGVALVIAVDVLKAVIAVLIGWGLMSIVDEPVIGKLFAGFCVILGHCYPAYYQYRGGKGVLSGVVVALMVNVWMGLICLLGFFIVIIFTRKVSLGSIVGTSLFPLQVWLFSYGGLEGLLALFCALVIIFRHRGNIVRLLNGTERTIQLGRRVEKKIGEDNTF
jgi:glycerol-3-phosphate acyltransferase PlsY